MEYISFSLSLRDCEIIMKGLLELPGKEMIETMKKFDAQVVSQLEKQKLQQVQQN